MTDFNVKFADVAIHITANFQITADRCREYYSSEPPEFEISITQEDIEKEIAIAESLPDEKKAKGPHKAEYMEWLALYRRLCIELTHKNTVLMHGSAIGVNGRAYLFCAPSGTGKSTHTRLWRQYLGDKTVMINDDKPLIRAMDDGTVKIYGTPWNGKHNLGNNISMPLYNICFLERGSFNEISPLSQNDALPKLMSYTFRPDAPEETILTLDTVQKISEFSRFWSLRCNMDPDAAKVAYEGM